MLTTMGAEPVSFRTIFRNKAYSRWTLQYIVKRMLMQVAYAENRRVEVTHDENENEHLVAPEGIASLAGPTAVFVEMSTQPLTAAEIRQRFERLGYWARKQSAESVLIALVIPTRRSSEDLTEVARQVLAPRSAAVYGPDMLDRVVQEHQSFCETLFREASWLETKDVIASGPEARDWKNQRQDRIEKLRDAYKRSDLVLILGAGVSSTLGLPDWNTLISRLLTSAMGRALEGRIPTTPEQQELISRALQRHLTQSPLADARYLRGALGEGSIDAVRAQLYNGALESSPLLESVVKLCLPTRKGPGVHAIITYNFDDLLERCLESADLDARPVYRDSDRSERHALSVYHVHGLVQKHSGETTRSDEFVVFSEEKYHELLVQPYVYSNLVQINSFRERTCLFIGVSLTDPNLRRLLAIAAKARSQPAHCAFLKRLNIAPEDEANSLPGYMLDEFVFAHHAFQENSLEELGVSPIWVDDHEEVPDLIAQIRRKS